MLDARDIRARARVYQACTRVYAGEGWIGGRACEDVPGQRSSTLLRGVGQGERGTARENSLSQSFRSESVIGRDIIDR